MYTPERFISLFDAYVKGVIDQADLGEFYSLVRNGKYDSMLNHCLDTYGDVEFLKDVPELDNPDLVFDRLINRINTIGQLQDPVIKPREVGQFRKWIFAAALSLIVVFGFYVLASRYNNIPNVFRQHSNKPNNKLN